MRTPSAIARPTPLPKRPKGRWFISLLLLASCGLGIYRVWQSFFRYRAYGTIDGRVLQLSPPWEGVIAYIHVREGEKVRQGQLLVTLENTELRQRYARLVDDIQVAQATLEAETAKLKWQAAFHLDEAKSATAGYYEAAGDLFRDQSELDRMRLELQRAQRMQAAMAGSVDRQALDRLRLDKKGQEQKIAKLQIALAEKKKRAHLADRLLASRNDLASVLAEDGKEQLKPFLAKIVALQAERARVAERLEQGRLLAPANGLVVKLHRFTGESCRTPEPVVSILEEGSLQVVLYLPQKASASLPVGANVDLAVEPYPEPLNCSVIRLGNDYEPAPEHIKRHYSAGQRLLPVYLEPRQELARWMALRIGGVVKLP